MNRSETVINDQTRFRIHPLLLDICDKSYQDVANSSDRLTSYKECFNSLPRAVLECSVREQILSETDTGLLNKRLRSVEAESQNLVSLLEQRELDCVSLERKLMDLQGSRSWKITAPLRALGDFLRLEVR